MVGQDTRSGIDGFADPGSRVPLAARVQDTSAGPMVTVDSAIMRSPSGVGRIVADRHPMR
jgi:hypothetical protein